MKKNIRWTMGAAVVLFTTMTPWPIHAQIVAAAPLNQHPYVEIVQALHEPLATELNKDIRVPGTVLLTSGSCGQANAFYMPAERQVVLCTELMDLIVQQLRNRQLSEDQVLIGFTSQLTFVLLHEVGHALIHTLDLPVLGQEEDAADQLAALLFVEEPVLAMWAADFWSQGSGSQSISMAAFADEHDLNQQRFFNITCWTYGADPLVRGYVVQRSGLTAERAQRCQGEFAQLRSAWERTLSPHLANPDAFRELSPTRNASGYWRFMEAMEDSNSQVRCTASGTLTLWQTGTDVSGEMGQEGSCVWFGTPIENNATGQAIATGQATDSDLVFTIAGCTYRGRFAGAGRTEVSGTVECAVEVEGGTLTLTGTWQAVR